MSAITRRAGKRFAGVAVDPDPAALRRLAELFEQEKLKVHVERAFPLGEVGEAHRLIEDGHVRGKLALIP